MVHKFQLHVPAGIAVSKNAEQNEKSVTTFPCTIAECIDCVAIEWFGSCPPICGLEGPGVRQRLSGWSDWRKSTAHLSHSIIPLPVKYEHTSPLTSNESDIDYRCRYCGDCERPSQRLSNHQSSLARQREFGFTSWNLGPLLSHGIWVHYCRMGFGFTIVACERNRKESLDRMPVI